jgi:hypothetical protein
MIAATAVSDRAPEAAILGRQRQVVSHTCPPNAGSFRPALGGVKTMPSASTMI